MTDLPRDWQWVPVRDLGTSDSDVVIGPFGSSLKVSDYRDSGTPLIFVKNIRSGDFRMGRRYVSPAKALELRAHEVRPGDVLVTKMGDPPGDAAVYREREPAIVTADCIRIRPRPDVLPAYVSYAMATTAVRQQVAAITRGVAQRKVSLGRFRQILLPVAPIHEQQRIVEVLEDHLSRLDAAEQLVNGSERRLLSWRKSWLDRIVRMNASSTGTLRDLVARIEAGKSFGGSAPPARDGHWGVIKVSAMTWGQFRSEDNKAVSGDRVDPRFEIRPGDVLVSRANTTEYVGAPVLVEATRPKLLLSDKSLRLLPRTGVDPRWLVQVLASPTTRRQISLRATGTKDSMRNISQAALLDVAVPTATPEQQERVITLVDSIDGVATLTRSAVSGAKNRSARLREALLEAAFTGRLAGRASDEEVVQELAGV